MTGRLSAMKVCLLNGYMFLTTTKFKVLDVKNFIGPGLS